MSCHWYAASEHVFDEHASEPAPGGAELCGDLRSSAGPGEPSSGAGGPLMKQCQEENREPS